MYVGSRGETRQTPACRGSQNNSDEHGGGGGAVTASTRPGVVRVCVAYWVDSGGETTRSTSQNPTGMTKEKEVKLKHLRQCVLVSMPDQRPGTLLAM